MNELQFNIKDYLDLVKYINKIKKPNDKKIMCTNIYDMLIENIEKINIVIINDFYHKNKKYIDRKINENHYNLVEIDYKVKVNNDFLKSLILFTNIDDDLEDLIDKPVISKNDVEDILKRSTATMSLLDRIGVNPLDYEESKPYLEKLFGIYEDDENFKYNINKDYEYDYENYDDNE